MTTVEIAILLVTAAITATFSGVLGMGGGIALLGVMTAILPAPLVVPLHGIVQLVSNFTRALGLHRKIVWRVFWSFAPTAVLGTAAAAALWSGDKLTYLRPVVGVFLLAFLIVRRRAPKLRSPPNWAYSALGLVVGFAGVWIGATGPLMAPMFLRDDFENEQVIATQAACQAVGHLLKLPAFVLLGVDYLAHGPLLCGLVAVVVVGTLIGRTILRRLEREVFVVLFEVLLGLLAVWLIVGELL